MDTDQAWREWAEQDPYYAVVSDDAFRGENLQRNLDRFFRSGDQLIASVLEQAKRHGMEPRRYELALDFGCGVGRLSMPLARRFQRVVGIDVSPEMLREAEKNCALFDIKNASFLVSDSALQGVEDQFDFVNS